MRMFPFCKNAHQCCDSYGLSLVQSIRAVSKKLAWLIMMFHGNLELPEGPELDKIQTIKELQCVKYELICLPLFAISQVDFMLETVCT